MFTGTRPCGPYVWFLHFLWVFLLYFAFWGPGGQGQGSGGVYCLFFFQLHLKEQKGPGLTLTNYYRGGKMKV